MRTENGQFFTSTVQTLVITKCCNLITPRAKNSWKWDLIMTSATLIRCVSGKRNNREQDLRRGRQEGHLGAEEEGSANRTTSISRGKNRGNNKRQIFPINREELTCLEYSRYLPQLKKKRCILMCAGAQGYLRASSPIQPVIFPHLSEWYSIIFGIYI